MNSRLLHSVLTRFRASFLATFPALTPQDLRTILDGPSETLLDLLQTRYGYTRAQAKAAWNDFVLVHVDGHGDDPCAAAHAPADLAGSAACGTPQALDAVSWQLMCLGWGRPSAPGGPQIGGFRVEHFHGYLH